MKLKRYNRYQMNFDSKWIKTSAACMGASVFLLAVYYFGLVNLGDIGITSILISLALPLVLSIVFIVLTQFMRWNAPGGYAILGAVFCVLLMIGSFSSGNVVRIVLAAIWYVLSAVVLIVCAGGYLPGRLPAALMFTAALIVRLLAFDIGKLSVKGWVLEAGFLCILLALVCLPMAFKAGKNHQRS